MYVYGDEQYRTYDLILGSKLPDGINIPDKGRFYEMLHLISPNNSLRKTLRRNGKVVKKNMTWWHF